MKHLHTSVEAQEVVITAQNFKVKVSVKCNVSNDHDPPGSLIWKTCWRATTLLIPHFFPLSLVQRHFGC